jgi:hypothetical protein
MELKRLLVLVALVALTACHKVGWQNPYAQAVSFQDPNGVVGPEMNVSANGEAVSSTNNVTQYSKNLLLDTVKATPGAVAGVNVISQDTTHNVYFQVSNVPNAAIGQDAGTLTPVMVYPLPAAALTATNYPGFPVQVMYPVVPKVYFDAGISYCVSVSATGCNTTGLDAGAYTVQVQYN